MSYFVTVLFFILTSNSILLLISRLNFWKNKKTVLPIFFSYGVGPFIYALIFYALIWLFPSQNDSFYVLTTSGLCLIIYIIGYKQFKQIVELNKQWIIGLWSEVKKISRVIVIISAVFVFLYSVQLFAYPIIDNDSAFYLNQSEAFYEYKNLLWRNEPVVTINGGEIYRHTSSVRPGIPNLVALSYLFTGGSRYDFFTFKFFAFYYYILLFLLFLYCIKKASKKSSLNLTKNLTFGIFFYVFYWVITRSLIYSAKEQAIYFLTLLSIVFVAEMGESKRNNWTSRILFGITLGINAFINSHGLVIECVMLLLYLLFVNQNLFSKIISAASIFLVTIPFGGLEFLTTFKFVFAPTLKMSEPTTSSQIIYSTHQDVYQIHTTVDKYIKGKLQVLTKVGMFGFNFWIFLVVLVRFFRKIFHNNTLRIIVCFIAIYYLVVIDPFSLNNNPTSIILWGSNKYSALLVLLGMIVTAVHINSLITWLAKIFKRYNILLLSIISVAIAMLFIFFDRVVDFGTNLLLSTIPVFKSVDFYTAVVEKFCIVSAVGLSIFCLSLILGRVQNSTKPIYYFSNMFIVLIIAVPLFLVTVGKVPLQNTFFFIGKTQRELLENVENKDVFLVFFKARKLLDQNTILRTSYREVTLYNDKHFLITPTDSMEYEYNISGGCDKFDEVIYSSASISLCKH